MIKMRYKQSHTEVNDDSVSMEVEEINFEEKSTKILALIRLILRNLILL